MRVAIYAWAPAEGLISNSLAFASKTKLVGHWQNGNFGDLYNFDLVDWLYGIDAQNTYFNSRAFFVGSTLHVANKRDFIMGAGLIRPSDTKVDLQKCLGLRGNLSLGHLSGSKKKNDIRFLGDPGILAKKVYEDKIQEAENRNSLFISHHQDFQTNNTMFGSKITVLSPDSKPLELAKQVAHSDKVYSSSLHGIIFAHSFGKPAFLLAPKAEPVFKYFDYLWYLKKWDFTTESEMLAGGGFEIEPPSESFTSDMLHGLPKISELKDFGIAR